MSVLIEEPIVIDKQAQRKQSCGAETIADTNITVGWIADIICRRMQIYPCAVRAFNASPIGVGYGYMSRLFRVDLEWADSRAKCMLPSSVVLKIPTPETLQESADNYEDSGSCVNNASADSFMPTLHNNECAALAALGRDAPLANVPLFYGSVPMSTVCAPGVIVMEDMTKCGCGSANMLDGMTPARIYSVIDNLAALYAWSIKHHEQLNDSGAGRVARTLVPINAHTIGVYRSLWESCQNPLIKMAPQHFDEKIFEKMSWLATSEQLMTLFCELDTMAAFNMPFALVHGDVWTNNILFRQNRDGSLDNEMLALVDWQTAHVGTPMEDIARLLSSSATAEFRRREKERVLMYFYERCTAHLGRTPPFTLHDMRRAYDFAYPAAVALFIMGLPLMLGNWTVFGHEDDSRREKRIGEAMSRARSALDDITPHMRAVHDQVLTIHRT